MTATARSLDGTHTLALEMGLRDLVPRKHPGVPYAYAASLGVVADAKPSLKTSAKYVFKEDRRDNPFTPADGSYFRASLEGAGKGRSWVSRRDEGGKGRKGGGTLG